MSIRFTPSRPPGTPGPNDHHVSHTGKFRPGLEPDYEEMLDHRDMLDAQIAQKLRERPMLKGTGFIVVAPSQPRLDGEEYEKREDAEERASEVAYQFGSAIVYAPIAVVKPRRDVVSTTPSKLLQQLGAALPAGAPVAEVEAPK